MKQLTCSYNSSYSLSLLKVTTTHRLVAGVLIIALIMSPLTPAWAAKLDVRIGVLTGQENLLLEAIESQCKVKVQTIVPQTAAKSIEQLREGWQKEKGIATTQVDERLTTAERDFSLLDFSGARERLLPVVAQLRTANSWSEQRLRVELLFARIAEFEGNRDELDEAVKHLAVLHLFKTPDPVNIPPSILERIQEQKNKLWQGNVVAITIQPRPEKLNINQAVIEPVEEKIQIPASVVNEVMFEMFYTQTGWLQTAGQKNNRELTPLADANHWPGLYANNINQLDAIWTIDAQGLILMNVAARGQFWRPETVDPKLSNTTICDVLRANPKREGLVATPIVPPQNAEETTAVAIGVGTTQAEKEPSRAAKVFKSPWFWTAILGAAAIGTGVGVGVTQAKKKNKANTGTIVLTFE